MYKSCLPTTRNSCILYSNKSVLTQYYNTQYNTVLDKWMNSNMKQQGYIISVTEKINRS